MQDESSFSLSVSIVCFNSSELELQALVSSLITAVKKLGTLKPLPPLPIFFIDNSQTPQLTLEIFGGFSDRLLDQSIELNLIRGHGNVGYGKGHNLILGKLESKYHLLLNPDVQLDENCLVQGIEYFEKNEDVVLSSPYAEFESGEKQYLCKRYPSVLTFLVRGFLPRSLRAPFRKRLATYEMHNLSEKEVSTDIPIISGCFMLCRSNALKSVNGFDEAYFLYFEDFDLSLRMGKIGSIAYIPTMRIRHAGGHAAKKGFSHIRMFAASGFRFFNTHGWRFFRQAG